MGRITGTMVTNGFGCPGIGIAAGGFMDITCGAVDTIVRTPAPVIGTIVITIAVTIVIATMIATATAVGIAGGIGAGVATNSDKASKRWRSGPA
jgi:hypothetical protein